MRSAVSPVGYCGFFSAGHSGLVYPGSMISLIIPVFNEEGAIVDTVLSAKSALVEIGEEYEIVVVDDGSNDGTADILATIDSDHLRIITHPMNKGYGASIMSGIRSSSGDVVGITDADGTYPVGEIPTLYRAMQDQHADMVVGARTKKGAKIPLIRKPAKMIVNALANMLVGRRVPDLNSGFRLFRRDLALEFMHLYPQRFSFTITITLAALTSGYHVVYVPIDYFTRVGSSALSAGTNGIKNFVQFLGLIVRITTYFRPLRFFGWPSVLLGLTGLIVVTRTVVLEGNISDLGVLLILVGIQVGLFGLLAEVVVRHGRK